MHPLSVLRRVRAQIGFYGFVVACLALALGASATVFTVADGFLFRPLPYPGPERLVYAQATLQQSEGGSRRFLVSPANFVEMRQRSSAMASLSAALAENLDLRTERGPTRVPGARATTDLFETLGVNPVLGRVFREQDGESSVVLLGEGFWRRALGGDPGALGTILDVGGRSREVIGIIRDVDAFPPATDLWVPYRPEAVSDSEMHGGSLQVVGRLAGGHTIETAQAEMVRVALDLEALFPGQNGGRGIEVGDLRVPYVENIRGGLLALLASVVVFFLAAMANVGALFLVRAGRASRLVAVRRALGASPSRIVTTAFVEAGAIGAVSAVLGALLAAALVPVLVSSVGAQAPGGGPTLLGLRPLLFGGAMTSFTAFACAVGPVLIHMGTAPARVLREESAGGMGSRAQRRAQSLALLGQTALGVVLVVSALASGGRILSLVRLNPGFGTNDAVAVRIPVPDDRYPSLEGRVAFLDALSEELEGISGVSAVGASDVLPVGDPNVSWALSVEDAPPADPAAFEVAFGRLVTPGYFEAAGIPVVSGRSFDERDGPEGPPVAVVSEAFAREHWGTEDVLGRRIKRRTYDSPFPWLTVVGVTSDVIDGRTTSTFEPAVYFPYAQMDTRLGREVSFVVRSDRATEGLMSEVRSRVNAVDPAAPIVRITTLAALLSDARGPERVTAGMMALFGAAGLLLLALGVYGILSRTLVERYRELGLRRALGADRGDVAANVVWSAGRVVVTGVVLGLLIGPFVLSWTAEVVGSTLSVPRWAYGGASLIVLLVGGLSSIGPAVKAATVDAAVALRGS